MGARAAVGGKNKRAPAHNTQDFADLLQTLQHQRRQPPPSQSQRQTAVFQIRQNGSSSLQGQGTTSHRVQRRREPPATVRRYPRAAVEASSRTYYANSDLRVSPARPSPTLAPHPRGSRPPPSRSLTRSASSPGSSRRKFEAGFEVGLGSAKRERALLGVFGYF